MNLTELKAKDIGQVVSIESTGDVPWYIEGTLYNLNAEQQFIEDYTLLGDSTTSLGDVTYTVNIAGWQHSFAGYEALETRVSIVNKVD